MKIYSIDSTAFLAKKSVNNKTKNVKQDYFTKSDFYSQIDEFMNNRISKEEYLQKFTKGVKSIMKQKSGTDYNQAEKNYINNLISTLEMSESFDIIPNHYIKEKMQSLVKLKK